MFPRLISLLLQRCTSIPDSSLISVVWRQGSWSPFRWTGPAETLLTGFFTKGIGTSTGFLPFLPTPGPFCSFQRVLAFLTSPRFSSEVSTEIVGDGHGPSCLLGGHLQGHTHSLLLWSSSLAHYMSRQLLPSTPAGSSCQHSWAPLASHIQRWVRVLLAYLSLFRGLHETSESVELLLSIRSHILSLVSQSSGRI